MQQLNTVSSPLKFKARRGAIVGALSVSTTEVGASADYTFSIQLSNEISSSSNSLIIVSLPVLYANSVTGSSGCVPACVSLSSSRVVFLASSLTALTSSSLNCTLKITQLTNPYQIGLTSSFSILTQLYQQDSQSIVDEITSSLTVALTSRQITSISVVADSSTVYHYPTMYTISVSNNNPIPAYSALSIVLPVSITVQQADISCMLGTRSVLCTYNSSTSTISITSISATAINAGALSALYISNLYNPSSTKPTSSLKFYIINPYSQTIQHKQSGLTFTATIPALYTTLSVIPSTTLNSDTAASVLVSYSLNMQ